MVMLTTQKKNPVMGMSAATAKSGSSNTPVPPLSNIGMAVNQVAGAAMGTAPVGAMPSYTPPPPVNTAQKPLSASQASTPTVNVPPIKPTYNEQEQTNYGTGALGNILSLKKYYDTGVANNNSGLKGWASANGGQYYDQLGADEAALVKGMNTQQLIDYINGKGKSGVSDVTTDTTQPVPSPYGQLSPDQINNEADYRIDQERLERERALGKLRGALQNDFDYSGKLIGDNRVLEDLAFQRSNSPFSGRTGYMETQLMRGRQIDDTARTRDFNNQLATAQQALYDWESLAPAQKNAMVNELTRIERQYGLDVGSLTGQIPGMGASGQTLASKQFEWNKDPSNPANVGQSISNKISQLNLDNMPQEIKLNLEKLQQDVSSGKISQQVAELQLKELTDPNSVTNKSKALDLQIKELEAKNLPEQQKLQLQQLRKSIEQIGKVAPTSEYDRQMQQIKLETAQEELAQLKSSSSGGGLSAKESADNYSSVLDQIQNAGPISKNTALGYLNTNSTYLSDSDYKKLNNWINDNF